MVRSIAFHAWLDGHGDGVCAACAQPKGNGHVNCFIHQEYSRMDHRWMHHRDRVRVRRNTWHRSCGRRLGRAGVGTTLPSQASGRSTASGGVGCCDVVRARLLGTSHGLRKHTSPKDVGNRSPYTAVWADGGAAVQGTKDCSARS